MTSTGAARNWDNQINAKQWGKFSFLSQLLLIQAGFNLDQESISCPNGLEPEAKAASGWSAREEGKGRRPEHHIPPSTQGKGWLTFMRATRCDQWPHPQPQTLAVQNSLLADGIVSLYLFPHSLLCMSAKNLPVISKLRQKVPPVLSAVNKHLPLHRTDLTRTEGCSVGLLPCKDIDSTTCSTGGDRCLEGALLPTIRAEYH